MPIYCYRCEDCEWRGERFERIDFSDAPVMCDECGGPADRDFGAELPVMNSRDGAGAGAHGTTGIYDVGAGQYFAGGVLGAEYRDWQTENTKDGVKPEPLSADQLDTAKQRCLNNHKPPIDEKEHHEEWMRCYREVRRERRRAEKIVVR